MNILLIDDDYSTVEMLQSAIRWNTLDIDEIFTANNIMQAKFLFLKNSIDIMLCDIEMPNGSGIELLEWIRDRKMEVKAIFLTNHAEFHFAQQALKLESIDFITKMSPIETIEAALRRAVNIVKTGEITKRYLDYGHHWEENKELLCRKFWQDLCQGKLGSEESKIQTAAKKYSIEPDIRQEAVIVYMTAFRYQDSLQEWSETELDFCIANIASEVFFNLSNSPYLINLEKENKAAFAAIFHPMVTSVQIKDIRDKCTELIQLYRKFLHCSVYFYISNPCACEHFFTAIKHLEELENNNAAIEQSITLESEAVDAPGSPAEPVTINYDELYPFLLTGQSSLLISKVKEYFITARNKSPDAQFLYSFSQHYIQLLYTAIKEKGLDLNQVLGEDRVQLLHHHSTDSVYDLLKWITVSSTRMADALKMQKQSLSVIVDVKKYIGDNYHNHLTKTEIANYVYLSPDYLAKVFKKETGIALPDYINQVRIDKSKPLLNDPSISLTDVASQVGFDYYSYYSTIFKKYEGISPKEYRCGNK